MEDTQKVVVVGLFKSFGFYSMTNIQTDIGLDEK